MRRVHGRPAHVGVLRLGRVLGGAMKAYDLSREELAAFIETDEGREFLERIDEGWDAAIEPARAAGFIAFAYGGVAVLSTYGAMLEESGAEHVAKMLQANGVEMPAGAAETPPEGR